MSPRPAHMGHVFDEFLRCRCGRSWRAHQSRPRPCSGEPAPYAKPITRSVVGPELAAVWAAQRRDGARFVEIARNAGRPASTVRRAIARHEAASGSADAPEAK